eukprot:3889486-Pleurochrysis_carterae.AAC.2
MSATFLAHERHILGACVARGHRFLSRGVRADPAGLTQPTGLARAPAAAHTMRLRNGVVAGDIDAVGANSVRSGQVDGARPCPGAQLAACGAIEDMPSTAYNMMRKATHLDGDTVNIECLNALTVA